MQKIHGASMRYLGGRKGAVCTYKGIAEHVFEALSNEC